MIADYRAVNRLVAQSALPMPRLEELGALLGGAAAFCTLDVIQGYWQTPFTPRRASSLRWSPRAGWKLRRECHRGF